MNAKIIVALCLCASVAVVDSTIIVATGVTAASVVSSGLVALGIGALAVAKGALIGSLIGGRGKRDVSQAEQEQSVQIALDLAQQIDTAGCVAKLLCEIEALPEDQLTANLANIKAIFGNPDAPGFHQLKTSRGVYDLAITFGAKLARGQPEVCDRLFEKCPLPKAVLFEMADSVFGCQ